jgi:hypothetical protein
MKSTPAMRARIRELMGKEQDDYDRAVECVLDDIETLEAALRFMLTDPPAALDEPDTDAEIIKHYREVARAALAPE